MARSEDLEVPQFPMPEVLQGVREQALPVTFARQAICPQTLSIRIDQAWILDPFLRSRSRAFARTRSLRMIAAMASFLRFPDATN